MHLRYFLYHIRFHSQSICQHLIIFLKQMIFCCPQFTSGNLCMPLLMYRMNQPVINICAMWNNRQCLCRITMDAMIILILMQRFQKLCHCTNIAMLIMHRLSYNPML